MSWCKPWRSIPPIPTRLDAGTSSSGIFKSSDGGLKWEPGNQGLTEPPGRDPPDPSLRPRQPVCRHLWRRGLQEHRRGSQLDRIQPRAAAAEPGPVAAGGSCPAFGPLCRRRRGGRFQDRGCRLFLEFGQQRTQGKRRCGLWPWTRLQPAPSTLPPTARECSSRFDGGVTWKGDAQGLSGLIIDALAVGPPPSRILVAGSYGDGVFMSNDQGATWSTANRGLPVFPVVRALLVDPSRAVRSLRGPCAAASSGVWTAGANWGGAGIGPEGAGSGRLPCRPAPHPGPGRFRSGPSLCRDLDGRATTDTRDPTARGF